MAQGRILSQYGYWSLKGNRDIRLLIEFGQQEKRPKL
jgi:hypothetical protein